MIISTYFCKKVLQNYLCSIHFEEMKVHKKYPKYPVALQTLKLCLTKITLMKTLHHKIIFILHNVNTSKSQTCFCHYEGKGII